MKCLKPATDRDRCVKLPIRVQSYPGFAIASLAPAAVGTRDAIPVRMTMTKKSEKSGEKSAEKLDQAALLAFLNHTVESARKEQIGFAEFAAKDVEGALQWRADGALIAVFTERHARTALEHLKLGLDLLPIYENLIDRLTLLASGQNAQAEIRAIAVLARSLKEWVS